MAKNPGRDAWANGGKGKAMGAPRDMQVRAAKGLGPNKASPAKARSADSGAASEPPPRPPPAHRAPAYGVRRRPHPHSCPE